MFCEQKIAPITESKTKGFPICNEIFAELKTRFLSPSVERQYVGNHKNPDKLQNCMQLQRKLNFIPNPSLVLLQGSTSAACMSRADSRNDHVTTIFPPFSAFAFFQRGDRFRVYQQQLLGVFESFCHDHQFMFQQNAVLFLNSNYLNYEVVSKHFEKAHLIASWDSS